MIETQRLQLIPLSLKQLTYMIDDIPKLEKELNCKYRGETLDDEFFDFMNDQIRIIKEREDQSLLQACWFILQKTDRLIIGSLNFSDYTHKCEEVEISYGLGKEYECNGYMTEALKALCKFALKQNEIKSIISQTNKNNIASQKVLENCNFKQYKQDNKNIWWRVQEHYL